MSRAIQRYQARKDGDQSESGFTLIELLIVIVVLGILAAVTVFALSGTTKTSAQAACNSDAATVNSAVQAFITQNPGTAPTAQIITSSGSPTTTVITPSNLVPNFLQSWPSNSSHYSIGITTGSSPYYVTVTPAGGSASNWTPGSSACSNVS